MANETELYLFGRSIGGDRQCRVEFFTKFLFNSRRVRLIGIHYGDMDDFLHDCFTNILRMSTSFKPEDKLSDWVESVATRTAMDRARLRKPEVPGSEQGIRMSAVMESDDVGDRQPVVSYMPPRAGPEDSPALRISMIVGEPQFTPLRKRPIENK